MSKDAGTTTAVLAEVTDDVVPVSVPPVKRRAPGERRWVGYAFLGPALILLLAILVYPIFYSVARSFFSDAGTTGWGGWVGLDNYTALFTNPTTFTAVKNNIIWIVVAPTVVTIVGLLFAVLSERIRWGTAFKLIMFMPMAISFVASGITFQMIYNDQPTRGLANAVAIGVHDTFSPSASYPTVHPRPTAGLTGADGSDYTSTKSYSPADAVALPLVGLPVASPPADARPAAAAPAQPGLHGTVWNDFAAGGGGTVGTVDPGELGLPGLEIDALQNGTVAATTTAAADGTFSFPTLTSGSYQLRLPASNFAPPYAGVSWLGPNLITPAILIAYLWVWAGFAMVLIASGLAAIPRDVLEAARIDGATEWQVFRRVTAPLLAPVLMVVFVTLVINVLKVFDLVYVITQGTGSGPAATVLAVQMYQLYSQGSYGSSSAIGIALVLLVLPAMLFNIRRFRTEQS